KDLFEACKQGNIEAFENLITKDIDINQSNTNGDSLLHITSLYSRGSSDEIFRLLLDKGILVDARNKSQRTALHASGLNGNPAIAQMLLEAKADINSRDIYNDTPLHFAVRNQKTEVAEALLKSRADINAKNNFELNPLHIASLVGNNPMIKMLIKSKANIHETCKKLNTPLHLGALSGNIDSCKTLIDSNAKIESINQNGHTPLFAASYKGNKEVIKLLIELGANCNLRDKNLDTPLFFSAIKNHKGAIQSLIESKADVNAQNISSKSVLLSYFKSNAKPDPEIVETLIKAGANVEAYDLKLVTPLETAESQGFAEELDQIICNDRKRIKDFISSGLELVSKDANQEEINDLETRVRVLIKNQHEFQDPILLNRMKDPHATLSGHSYEGVVIKNWFKKSQNAVKSDPKTGQLIGENPILIQNHNLRIVIEGENKIISKNCFDAIIKSIQYKRDDLADVLIDRVKEVN
ncbi:MAG: ankyrin repeat domain-containing RING finger protein, partial [Alphaproteobacteria bacterium]